MTAPETPHTATRTKTANEKTDNEENGPPWRTC